MCFKQLNAKSNRKTRKNLDKFHFIVMKLKMFLVVKLLFYIEIV